MTESPSALDISRQAYQNLLIEILEDTKKDPKCQVISVEAEWGYGKTTLLERVGDIIAPTPPPRHSAPDAESPWFKRCLPIKKMPCQARHDEKNYLWVEFNPWQYEDPKHLLTLYFNELRANFAPKFWSRECRGWLKKALYWLICIKLAYYIPLTFSNTLKIYERINQGEERKSLHAQRIKINNALKKSKYDRIFVVIEDLDRLPPKDVYDIIQMVRMVADFDKITYILAFAKDHVVDALDQYFHVNNSTKSDLTKGDEYLRRIINRRTAMPFLPNEALGKYLADKIEELRITPDERNIEHWNYNIKEISSLISTPRQANMIADQVSLLDSALKSIRPNPLHLLVCAYFMEFEKKLWDEIFVKRYDLCASNAESKLREIIPSFKDVPKADALQTMNDTLHPSHKIMKKHNLLRFILRFDESNNPKYQVFYNPKIINAFFVLDHKNIPSPWEHFRENYFTDPSQNLFANTSKYNAGDQEIYLGSEPIEYVFT